MIKNQRKKVTVSQLLSQSSVNDILDEMSKAQIKDCAVVFRRDDGEIISRWIGDNLALTTMAVILAHDIENDIGVAEDA